MNHWYYSDYQRNRHGPVSADDLAELHHQQQLEPDTPVWREGLPQWRPWREIVDEVVGGHAAAVGAATSHASPAGVNPYAPAEPVRSPYAPPRAALSAHSGHAPAGADVVDAGFRKRAAAYLIDALILTIAGWVVQMVVLMLIFGAGAGIAMDPTNPAAAFANGGVMLVLLGAYLLPIAMQAVYYAWFHASARQATPGKMAVGIKVTDNNGQPISVGRGIGRYFGFLLSGMILGIGYLMAAFTERKRALHDMICDTLVVDQWAYTAHPERQRRELGAVTVAILVVGGLLMLLMIGGVVATVMMVVAAGGAG